MRKKWRKFWKSHLPCLKIYSPIQRGGGGGGGEWNFTSLGLQTCAKCTDSDHPAYAQSMIWILFSPFIHSVVSNDSVGGQRRLWLDCPDAQADLGLHCPNTPKDMFSHGGAHSSAQVILNPLSEIPFTKHSHTSSSLLLYNPSVIPSWSR